MIHHINYGLRDSSRLFHHAWSGLAGMFRGFRLEVWSGPTLRLEFQRGEAGDGGNECSLCIGAGFFTASLRFPVPEWMLLKRKCIATWDNNREFWLVDGRKYGFYFHEWAFVRSWHAKIHESSSSDPWWMHQYIRLDDLVLGERESVRRELQRERDIWFRLGDKEFKVNRIKWERSKTFRTRIPFALWHRTRYHVEVRIDKPPMRSGKGENSWDCGDDGSFAMSAPWEGPVPRWDSLAEITPLAVAMYVEGVLKDAKRYGGSRGERGISANDKYEYIGRKQPPATPSEPERSERE